MEILLGQIRISKGVTLMELENRTGISRSSLNNYENGKIVPDLLKLEKIAIALDVGITELFESEYK